jgi:hypothetical protein
MKRTGACRIERVKYSLIACLLFFSLLNITTYLAEPRLNFPANGVSQHEPRVQRQSFVRAMGAIHLAKLQK